MKLKLADNLCVSVDKEWMLKITLAIAWAPTLLVYLRGVLLRFPFITEDNIDAFVIVCALIPIVLSIPVLIRRLCLIDYTFYILCVAYFISGYLLYPENETYLDKNALTCIFCVFPYYFIGRIVNIDKSFNLMLMFSTLCILMDLLYYLILAPKLRAGGAMNYDNMWGAYMALPHTTLMLWAMLEKFRLWKVLMFFFGILFILSCGTRGPFVCMGFFGVIFFLFYMRFRGAFYVKIGIISMGALVLLTLNTTLFYITKLFARLGLSTRILEKIVTGELGDDSHRSVLRDKIYSILDSGNHFWGLGAFGCQNYGIIYPHVLYLDLFCTFGYLVGTFILILLTLLIVCALWISKGESRIFIIFLFSISIVKLLFSNSFILEPFFYFLVGVCVHVLINYRLSKNNIDLTINH